MSLLLPAILVAVFLFWIKERMECFKLNLKEFGRTNTSSLASGVCMYLYYSVVYPNLIVNSFFFLL